MDLSLRNLLSMARDTIVAPRAGAAEVMQKNLPPVAGWLALALMAVASALLNHVSFAMMPIEAKDFFAEAMRSPIRTAILQWVAMLMSVQLIHKIGRMRGGTGSLADTVVLVAWLQFILLILQSAQIVVQIVIPPLGGLLSLASVVLLFWLLTNFIAELHGFRSLPAVFVGILVTLLVTALALAILFAVLLGLTGRV